MKRFFQAFRRLLRRIFMADDRFLCDTCKYDYGSACTRPERPNATECDDYARL